MRDRDGIETTRRIAAPIDEVWAAVTDAPSLAEWFGADVLEFEARTGGRLVVRTEDGSVRRAYVEECIRPERIVFRWLPFDELSGGSTIPRPQTTVVLSLMEDSEGTLVTVVETYGFASASHGASSLARA